ncbi:MAG: hypothetical protein RDU25_02970 [Patescibacteria group bacterium]|nr:hypothetical protein [Patescibacteria group bacterium]
MFGVLLMLVGTFFEELSTSIGKIGIRRHLESPFSFGFINSSLVTVVFLALLVFRWDGLVFSVASLPYLGVRILLEMVLATVTLQAIAKADRSTFGFLRTLTIPLILVIDLSLAYEFDYPQIIGIVLIVCALLFLFLNHGLSRKGAGLSLLSAVLASLTISLYKFNITHFNSPEIDQSISNFLLLFFFFVMAKYVYKEDALKTLWHRRSLRQSAVAAFGSLVESYAYIFAPASVIVAAKRSLAVFWSVLSGKLAFHERKLVIKLIALLLCAIGLSLLAF